jgi:phosphoglycolate phosphatase-like HAD superfamily hydrolase
MALPLNACERIYVDLDGPILACERRHHAVLDGLLRTMGAARIECDTLWERKRRGETTQAIAASLCKDRADAARIARLWIERVEEVAYLQLDTVHAGVRWALRTWTAEGHDVRLISARRFPNRGRRQLEHAGLTRYFYRTIFCDPRFGKSCKIRHLEADLDRRVVACLVGDSEVDIVAAKTCGIGAFAVACGVRDAMRLACAGADCIKPSLVDYVVGGHH